MAWLACKAAAINENAALVLLLSVYRSTLFQWKTSIAMVSINWIIIMVINTSTVAVVVVVVVAAVAEEVVMVVVMVVVVRCVSKHATLL